MVIKNDVKRGSVLGDMMWLCDVARNPNDPFWDNKPNNTSFANLFLTLLGCYSILFWGILAFSKFLFWLNGWTGWLVAEDVIPLLCHSAIYKAGTLRVSASIFGFKITQLQQFAMRLLRPRVSYVSFIHWAPHSSLHYTKTTMKGAGAEDCSLRW